MQVFRGQRKTILFCCT